MDRVTQTNRKDEIYEETNKYEIDKGKKLW